ncbi:WD40 repeat domain-containing protein [Streptomyces turgidiscabies]|uniref:WD domain, G-beta repeat protein n=1 Tax=Streptomyces turgidiscabies (strain Car8) TaxID=698760 RepID=L7ETX4_STRT8|nr:MULTISPECIES: WD40 repeat domain-containing protein [Streptomyces]ELP62136.1 WD domain, G-beta repeat protein [Streptomyces turgidiscabies Car8]MDX3498150.1 WD40 repeat domain-containing protein [Streptomyces turgidiscabies]GAQ75122.1 WD domain, G-beta repeat [Streptomyces turgidiscabies]
MSEPGTVALRVAHEGSVEAVAFSPDSIRFAGGGSDTLLRVRTVGIGAALDVAVDGSVTGIAFSPDGSELAAADFEKVSLRDSSTGSAVWEGPLDPGNSVNTVQFGPNGQLIAATDTLVAVLDQATGTITRRITVERPLIAGVDLSRDGTRVALAVDERHGGDHRSAGSARVVELATGTEIGRLTPDNAVFAVAFSPDGKLVLCCSADDTTRMFEAQDGAQVWPTPEDVDDQITSPNCLAYDPKGKWTVVGGADGFARVLDADTGVERGRAPKLTPGAPDPGFGAVTQVAFSPNGRLAASASIDNVVRLFNIDGKELYAVTTEEVLTMRFSPNGRWLGLGTMNDALVIDNGEANQTNQR